MWDSTRSVAPPNKGFPKTCLTAREAEHLFEGGHHRKSHSSPQGFPQRRVRGAKARNLRVGEQGLVKLRTGQGRGTDRVCRSYAYCPLQVVKGKMDVAAGLASRLGAYARENKAAPRMTDSSSNRVRKKSNREARSSTYYSANNTARSIESLLRFNDNSRWGYISLMRPSPPMFCLHLPQARGAGGCTMFRPTDACS